MKTPYYIIEESKLRRNLQLIATVSQEADVDIILAFKAFALWKTFPIFREFIHATTASSLNEARMAYEQFGSPCHTYSPAYTDHEIDRIAAMSSHLTFNSLSQYDRLAGRAKKANPDLSIGLRVNPEYSEVGTDIYNPCAPGTRFGVTDGQLPHQLPPLIEGFHCHCHCESGADVFERTLVHIERRFSRWFPQLQWINFGGGHLMTRADYDVPRLIRLLNDFHRRYPHLKVILEPGSAFAWKTGYLLSHVVDIVENSNIRTAILDVSFTCHMPDCLEMPYMPEVRGATIIDPAPSTLNPQPSTLNPQPSTLNTKHSTLDPRPSTLDPRPSTLNTQHSTLNIYRLGGNSCLSGDFLGFWQFDHELQIGEELIFEDMIHYTTVKTNMFNGVAHPGLAMLHTDGTLEILRDFTYDDYLHRMD